MKIALLLHMRMMLVPHRKHKPSRSVTGRALHFRAIVSFITRDYLTRQIARITEGVLAATAYSHLLAKQHKCLIFYGAVMGQIV
jgi:hypothetical protein